MVSLYNDKHAVQFIWIKWIQIFLNIIPRPEVHGLLHVLSFSGMCSNNAVRAGLGVFVGGGGNIAIVICLIHDIFFRIALCIKDTSVYGINISTRLCLA